MFADRSTLFGGSKTPRTKYFGTGICGLLVFSGVDFPFCIDYWSNVL